MTKIIKRIAVFMSLAITQFSYAGAALPFIAIPASGSSEKQTFTAIDGGFVVQDFDFALSAGVAMIVQDSGDDIAVLAGSEKGSDIYAGSMSGGGVLACGALCASVIEEGREQGASMLDILGVLGGGNNFFSPAGA